MISIPRYITHISGLENHLILILIYFLSQSCALMILWMLVGIRILNKSNLLKKKQQTNFDFGNISRFTAPFSEIFSSLDSETQKVLPCRRLSEHEHHDPLRSAKQSSEWAVDRVDQLLIAELPPRRRKKKLLNFFRCPIRARENCRNFQNVFSTLFVVFHFALLRNQLLHPAPSAVYARSSSLSRDRHCCARTWKSQSCWVRT